MDTGVVVTDNITSKKDWEAGKDTNIKTAVDEIVFLVEQKLSGWAGDYSLSVEVSDKPRYRRAAQIAKKMYEDAGWEVNINYGSQREPGLWISIK